MGASFGIEVQPRFRPMRLRANPLLWTDALEVTYGRNATAINRCSLQFEAGEFVVLLGASGAGKSTLLRSLNGLVKPTAGKVVVGDVGDIKQRRALRLHRRRTGMIFQQHHLIGRSSVLSNVLVGRLGFHSSMASLLPSSRAEKLLALQAIERVGLLDYALQRADRLSGGQQQRVGIARALVQTPTLLLADEPIASLDPSTALHLLSLLHRICKEDGLTAIVSLHQVDIARRFADRIIGLSHGDVVFDGPPDQLTDPLAADLYRAPPVKPAASTSPATSNACDTASGFQIAGVHA